MSDLGIPGVGDATLIASGGSALVYRALDATGRPIAVKVLRGIRGQEVTRRFEREQTATERLKGHPNIISIEGTGVTGAGEPYLIMPLVAGGSLHDELQANGPFSVERAVADVVTAAQAIDWAHQRGVLHRDVKPGNLLRSDDGSVLVTDFGIARVTNAGITSATVGAATPLFAAPELLADNDASVQSEVYSLGALLYALLSGKAAFEESDNLWATIHRVQTEPPPPLPHVPAPIMAVIDRAMAKDPRDRPAGAGVLAAYLRTAMKADPTWRPPRPAPATQDVAGRRGAPGAPPAPAFDRPAAPVGTAPVRERQSVKVVAALAALAVVGGLAWLAATTVFSNPAAPDVAQAGPVDTSLPSPSNGAGESDAAPATDESDAGSTEADENVRRLVRFSGDHYTALLPDGWSLLSKDVDVSYGFRSQFLAPDMYLNIDTTLNYGANTATDIATSAVEIASTISSASDVRTETIDGRTLHTFTFVNTNGVQSIDIFFEVEGDGYAVVAGSATDPATAFATAKEVALSVQDVP